MDTSLVTFLVARFGADEDVRFVEAADDDFFVTFFSVV